MHDEPASKGAPCTTSIVEINTSNRTNTSSKDSVDRNPLIARGAFGHVDIALLVRWASSSLSKQDVQSVSLAAIKTIPNASIVSSESSSLTREAFAELNALRLLNGHDNVTPLLGYYGARDTLSSNSSGGGGGFGGWDWAEDARKSSASSAPSSLCLVFPYHPIDLADALNYRRLNSFANGPPHQSFSLPSIVIQSIVHGLLSALKHLHENYILHRDIKPGNVYITMSGRVQLGDFGLAKAVPPVVPETSETNTTLADDRTYQNVSVTQGLCTLQYRPPELLLGGNGIIQQPAGENGANGALDIWSAGCIVAELLTLSGPLFPGQSVLDQLGRIFRVLGTPNADTWPRVKDMPDWNKVCFEQTPGTGLEEKLSGGKDQWSNAEELLSSMLSLDPCRRPSAQQCLDHASMQPFGSRCKNDKVWKDKAQESVVKELIPSFLRIANPIYISASGSTADNGQGCSNGDSEGSCIDPLAYAKKHASKLAASRRSFPQSLLSKMASASTVSKSDLSDDIDTTNDTDTEEPNQRWKCSTTKNGLADALRNGSA